MTIPFMTPGERFSFASAPFENFSSGSGTGADLSAQFFNDSSLSKSFQEFMTKPLQSSESMVFGSPFAAVSSDASSPLLSTQLKEFVSGAGSLEFSTPADNAANGVQPDFKLVEGTDGKLRLEPTGNGDPLSDGKLNIELDTKNKSLADAIKQSDANLKEYIRELMAYWTKNNPGKPYPGWWNDILSSEPNIPNNPAPVPVERTPEQFRPQPSAVPEPPAAPSQGWQPDYRGGSGPGYGGGGSGGGSRGGSGDYYHGGGNGRPDYSIPNEVPNFDDSTGFIDRLAKTVMKNEGALKADGSPNFEAYNPDDNGGISVGLRQWHAGGALPELLNAWQQKNPEKFQEYFKGYSPAQINGMSSGQFASRPELVQGMKSALADKEYQGVQMQLIQDWVKREVKVGMDQGLTGEKELAVFVDIANQYGQDDALKAAGIGKAAGDQGQQMNASIRGGQYAERFANIDANFSNQVASLEQRVPQPTEFGERLASAVKGVDANMAGTGRCAAAVQIALDKVGLGQFMGSGDAWDMLGPLERSGQFVRVPQSEAAVGDLIVRPPSANRNDNSIHGDISVVTARKGDQIVQTNDATYAFERSNPRYDGKAVFLRYVGDQDSGERLASNKSKSNEEGADKKKDTKNA